MCLAVWVCFKIGSENMLLVVLLQIGAKDFTVISVLNYTFSNAIQKYFKTIKNLPKFVDSI